MLAGAGSGKTSVLTQRISYMMRFGNAYHSTREVEYTPEERAHLEACLEMGWMPTAKALWRRIPSIPYHILAITFTNKAAREMRERVEKLAGDKAGKLWVSTFHFVLLPHSAPGYRKLGMSNNFTIYDDENQMSILKDILKQLNLSDKTYPPREIKAKIGDAKMNMLTRTSTSFAQSDKGISGCRRS